MKYLILSLLLSIHYYSLGQKKSEIILLEQPDIYEYKSFYDGGQIKSSVCFLSKKPFSTVEEFEAKLKDYKIKRHGKRAEYYENGQLKEIVVYENGKVKEFMKSFFEDGEEYSASVDKIPNFQFPIEEHQNWINNEVLKIEKRIGKELEGTGLIVLEIYKTGKVRDIKVKSSNIDNEPYLLEIAKNIQVLDAAKKGGQNMGTRFSFKVAF